jgi:hypothetical protein
VGFFGKSLKCFVVTSCTLEQLQGCSQTATQSENPLQGKGCTVLHTGLISCSTGTSIRARGPDCPALGSQRGSSYHELRTLLSPNKSYQLRLASVEPRTSRRHVRHNFITSEGEIPVQCLTTEPRPDDDKRSKVQVQRYAIGTFRYFWGVTQVHRYTVPK